MSTRESILAAVLKNQPPASPLPDMSFLKGKRQDIVSKYSDVFTSIGGRFCRWIENRAAPELISTHFDATRNALVTTLPDLGAFEVLSETADPRTFDDVELAVIEAQLAVAENGAVWLPEQRMGQRIIPYICQHLAVVVRSETIVPTLHEAYEQIGVGDYGFGAFIGGPSKTADIEQALVMGAHGPITMSVFILNKFKL
jgi:L-lactate dehydrogenase complex protein LldG